jgi:hypothetical protein
MSAALIGAIIGLAVGAAAFASIAGVAARVEKAETKRVLRIAGMADLIILPVVGWFAAPMIFGGA